MGATLIKDPETLERLQSRIHSERIITFDDAFAHWRASASKHESEEKGSDPGTYLVFGAALGVLCTVGALFFVSSGRRRSIPETGGGQEHGFFGSRDTETHVSNPVFPESPKASPIASAYDEERPSNPRRTDPPKPETASERYAREFAEREEKKSNIRTEFGLNY